MIRRTLCQSLRHTTALFVAHGAYPIIPSAVIGSAPAAPAWASHLPPCDGCSVPKEDGLSVALTESEAVMFGSSECAATTSLPEQNSGGVERQEAARVFQQLNHRSTSGASTLAISLRNGNHASRLTNKVCAPPPTSFSAVESMSVAGTSSQNMWCDNASSLSRFGAHPALQSDGCASATIPALPLSGIPRIYDNLNSQSPQPSLPSNMPPHTNSKSSVGNTKVVGTGKQDDARRSARHLTRHSNHGKGDSGHEGFSSYARLHSSPSTHTYHNPSAMASMLHRVPTCSIDSPHFGGDIHHGNGSLIGATGMMAASTMAARPRNSVRGIATTPIQDSPPPVRLEEIGNRRSFTSENTLRVPEEEQMVDRDPSGSAQGYREEYHKAISRKLNDGVRRGTVDPADVISNLHHVPDVRRTVIYPENKSIPLDPIEEALQDMDDNTAASATSGLRSAETPMTTAMRRQSRVIGLTPNVVDTLEDPESGANLMKEEADEALDRGGLREEYEAELEHSGVTADAAKDKAIENDERVLWPAELVHKMHRDDRYNVNAPSERTDSGAIVKDSDSNFHRLRRRSSLPTLRGELRRLRKQQSNPAVDEPSTLIPPSVIRDADGYAIMEHHQQPNPLGDILSIEAEQPSGLVAEAVSNAAHHRPQQRASIIIPDAAMDSFAIGGRAQLLKFADTAFRTKVLTKRRRDRVRRKLGSEGVMGIAVAASGHTNGTEFVTDSRPSRKPFSAPSAKLLKKHASRKIKKASRKKASSMPTEVNPENDFLSQVDRDALEVQSNENYRLSNNPVRNEPTTTPTTYGTTVSQVPGLGDGVQLRTSDGTVRIGPDTENRWFMDTKRKRWVSRGMGAETRDANRGRRYYKT